MSDYICADCGTSLPSRGQYSGMCPFCKGTNITDITLDKEGNRVEITPEQSFALQWSIVGDSSRCNVCGDKVWFRPMDQRQPVAMRCPHCGEIVCANHMLWRKDSVSLDHACTECAAGMDGVWLAKP